MTEEQARVPRLRFPGFAVAWEQRKLGDVAEFSKGHGYSKDDLGEEGDPIILYGRLYTDYEVVVSSVNTYVTKKANSVLSQGGDIIIPASGETAEDIARASVVETPGIILGGDLNVVRLRTSFAPEFVAREISNGACQKELSKKAQGKSVVHIHSSDLQEVILKYPALSEQRRIGAFFASLDDLIALHQRKLSHLGLLKKGLLQKMFPKPGEAYPEIRFPGFAVAWEQRKLGELVDVRSGQDYKHLSTGDIPVYGTGGYMLSVDRALSYSEDAVGIGRKGTIDKPYVLHAPFWTVDTLFYAVPRDGIDLGFLYSIFERVNWRGKDESTGVPSLSKKTINDVDVASPNTVEQRQIGAFFASLDDLIALHQRKLTHLQQQKKALLQQMFV